MGPDYIAFEASDERDPDGSRLRGVLSAHYALDRNPLRRPSREQVQHERDDREQGARNEDAGPRELDHDGSVQPCREPLA